MIISKARLLKHVVVLSNNKVKINWFGYSDFLSFFGNVFHKFQPNFLNSNKLELMKI